MRIFPQISCRFPFELDSEALLADLETSEKFEFSKHPLRYHDGSWTAINLMYAGGSTEYTHDGDYGYGAGDAEATPVLAECPYFQDVLERLPGKKIMARLSALPPGGRILRHYDPIESADFGQLRLHIPIRSNPSKVVFHLGFLRQRWRPGELWYGDFTFPHSVYNKADYTRVNMIIDIADVDDYREFFPEEFFSERTSRARERFRKEARSMSWRLDRLTGMYKPPKQAA